MKQKIPAVSVIIPMYNAEKFIAASLESVLAQKFKDFEIIVVDDCSTDNSVAIVEKYLKRGGVELKLVRSRANFGNPGVPRNKGLNVSRGKYIFFMDNDDLLMDYSLGTLYHYAENYKAEVVYTYRNFVFDAQVEEMFPKELKILSRRQTQPVDKPFLIQNNAEERLSYYFNGLIDVQPWLKFLRRDFLIENELYFPQIYSDEDDFWTVDLLLQAEKFLVIPDACYINRINPNSITRNKKTPNDIVKFFMYFVIFGPENIKRVADKHTIFNERPQFYLTWMERLSNYSFSKIFPACANLSPYEVYNIFYEVFAQDIGEHAELISYLCSKINLQQKQLYMANQQLYLKNKRIAELEKFALN